MSNIKKEKHQVTIEGLHAYDYYKKWYSSTGWDKELLEFRLNKREKEMKDLCIQQSELHYEIDALKKVLKK